MNKKTIIMWVCCIMCWVFFLVGRLVKPSSIIAYWVIFGLQMACFVGVSISGIWIIIDLKKKERELEKLIMQNEKEIQELLERIASTINPDHEICINTQEDEE